MAIDTSIYGQLRPAQVENPLDTAARVAQIQGAQNQNRLADLVFGEKQREVGENNALSQLYKTALKSDGTIDRSKLFAGAADAGLGNKIPALQKTFAEQDKATADLEKTRWDAANKKLEIAGQAFGYVRNNPTLDAANSVIDYLGQNGVYDAPKVAYYKQLIASDPTKIKALADQAFQSVLATKEQLSQFQTRNTGGTTDTIEINPLTGKTQVVSSVQNTISPDAQSAANTAAANRAQTERHFQAGQNAPEYKQDADGNWVALPKKVPTGGQITAQPVYGTDGKPLGGNSKLTEDQGKATTFAARMADAGNIINQMEAKGVTGKDLRTQLAGNNWTNWAASPEGQQYRQAQENWVTANLRKESGAVIGKDEMDAEIRKYFPVAGDKPENIAQKARARAVAQQGMLVQAGPGAKSVDGILTKAGASPATSTTIPADAIKFLKANPSLRSQFEAKYGAGSAASVLGQ